VVVVGAVPVALLALSGTLSTVVLCVVWGGALISSLVPRYGISWQGHLCGAIGGVVAAWLLAVRGAPGDRPRPPAGTAAARLAK